MKEIPILFSAPMMRANLAGTKDVTRRVVKPGLGQAWMPNGVPSEVVRWEHRKDGWWSMQIGEPNRIVHCGVEMDGGHIGCIRCPYGSPGDVLWAKETYWMHDDWNAFSPHDGNVTDNDGNRRLVGYAASMDEESARIAKGYGCRLRPSIHMPRWACRFTAKIVSVRIERLQEITEADAIREGVERHIDDGVTYYGPLNRGDVCPRRAYAHLWDSINGPGAWERNDWVWRIEYRNPHKEYA